MRRTVFLAGLLLTIAALQPTPPLAAQTPPPPSVASLGTCVLASGAMIHNCRIAYRTFGRLNASRSNAVLIPTWLLGRSDQWISLLGQDGLVDTTRFYTIVVDAFSNGLSSSPSNSGAEDQRAFRDLTIGDMVEAQHRLVVEHLNLPRLHAVMGVSMGGFQSFEWAVRYPEFVDAVIPIMGSPRIGAFDRTLWSIELSEIRNNRAHGVPDDSTWVQIARFLEAFLRTPRAVNDSSSAAADRDVQQTAQFFRRDWKLEDFESQLAAAFRQDVSAPFDGDMSRAAARVRAPMLIVYSWDDHMVTAEPAVAFAKLVKADTLSIHSTCGHVSPGCESAAVNPAVRHFLENRAQRRSYNDSLLVRIRAAARTKHGELPRAINYLKFAEAHAPKSALVANAESEPITVAFPVFQIRYRTSWIMIDAGFDREIWGQFYPHDSITYWPERWNRIQTALRDAQLVLLTHEHWDHAAGIERGAYVKNPPHNALLTADQIASLVDPPSVPYIKLARDSLPPYQKIDYDDVYSPAPGVVLTRAPGHTPGSQWIYVSLASGREFLIAGDLVWNMAGLETGKQRPVQASETMKEDRDALQQQIDFVRRLTREGITVLVSHDDAALSALVRAGVLHNDLDLTRVANNFPSQADRCGVVAC